MSHRLSDAVIIHDIGFVSSNIWCCCGTWYWLLLLHMISSFVIHDIRRCCRTWYHVISCFVIHDIRCHCHMGQQVWIVHISKLEKLPKFPFIPHVYGSYEWNVWLSSSVQWQYFVTHVSVRGGASLSLNLSEYWFYSDAQWHAINLGSGMSLNGPLYVAMAPYRVVLGLRGQ